MSPMTHLKEGNDNESHAPSEGIEQHEPVFPGSRTENHPDHQRDAAHAASHDLFADSREDFHVEQIRDDT